MPTPEDYAYLAAQSAEEALLSANTATAKAVETDEDRVSAAQWAADAYDYMLNARGHLGASSTPPPATQIGQTYWNSVNGYLYAWNGSAWVLPAQQFNGIIDAGLSNSPIGKVQLRRDLSGLWSLSNPILSAGELGIETDTHKLKVGDGTLHWNDLPYVKTNKASIVGIENVDNTSDVNKPVSTAQQAAIDLALQNAKDYYDSSSTGHFVDVGTYSIVLTNAYPTTGGTGTDGLILKGNVFTCTSSGVINGTSIPSGSLLRALVDNPTQDDVDWHITFKPITFDKPYIIQLNVPGVVLADTLYPQHIFTTQVTFTQNFVLSLCKSRIFSTNQFVFYVRKNGVQVGTVTFAAGTAFGVYESSSTITFNVGDVLELKSQTNPDPSLYDVSFSIYGSRV